MKGFLPTLVLGLAMLFMVGAGIIITLAMAAEGDVRTYLRTWLLSESEQALLREEAQRPPRPPLVRTQPSQDQDRIIQDIADRVSSNQVRELLAQLRQRQTLMEERRAYLDQREAELRIAEADLLRMQQALQRQRQELEQRIAEREERYAQFAAVTAQAVQQMNIMSEVRRRRMRDSAKLFEAMGRAAWQSLRRFPAEEIAAYLALMDTKKAADIIREANNDRQLPDITYQIHREWLKLDTDGVSRDRLEQLAALYAFMPAGDVATVVTGRDPEEAAAIVGAMQRQGSAKRAADLLEAMRRIDDGFERQVQQLLVETEAGGGA